jgi:serine/threonine protein kinase
MTYLAKDDQRPGHPICVIKRFSPTRRDSAFLKAAHRLFQTEAQILENLGRQHDRIPQLLAYFEEDKEFYLVQDYVPGHPFSEELQEHLPMSPAATLDMMQDVLPTLQFIHSHRVIHRDLKPSNLIRRTDNALVVIDFGAVKHMDGAEAKTISVGTPGYIPTEQMAGYPQFNSDLYALGMIAIQCLTTIPPQNLSTDPDTGDPLWQPLVLEQHRDTPDIHPLIEFLQKLTQLNSGDRYPSADSALRDLKKLQRSWRKATVT